MNPFAVGIPRLSNISYFWIFLHCRLLLTWLITMGMGLLPNMSRDLLWENFALHRDILFTAQTPSARWPKLEVPAAMQLVLPGRNFANIVYASSLKSLTGRPMVLNTTNCYRQDRPQAPRWVLHMGKARAKGRAIGSP